MKIKVNKKVVKKRVNGLLLICLIAAIVSYGKYITERDNRLLDESSIYLLSSGRTEAYVVKSGDCLSTIAERYVKGSEIYTMVDTIQKLNGIDDKLQPGQIIQIPSIRKES